MPETTRLDVGPLRFTTDDPALGRWLDVWRDWAGRWGGQERESWTMRWRVGVVNAPVTEMPEHLWGRVRAGLVEGRPVFAGADGGAVRVGAGTVTVQGTPDPEDTAWHLLLEAVLFELLGAAGCLCVHGGALAVDGVGWLVAGDSGVGKSTFVHLASRAGAEAVSDDVTLLRRLEGRWQAHGTSTSARLAPGPHLPEIDGRADLDERGKVRIPARAARPRTRLKGMLLLQGAPGKRSFRERLGQEEVTGLLLRQAALALEPAAATSQLRLLTALGAEVPAWRLRLGRELLAEPSRTLGLLGDS